MDPGFFLISLEFMWIVYQKFMYKMFCYEIYSLMYNYL